MVVKEGHEDKTGGRKAYGIEVFIGCKKISLITVTISYNFWR